MPALLRAHLGQVQTTHASRAGKSRIQHELSETVLRLLGRARGTGRIWFLQFRPW
ncbi:MAG: hypothetical protein EXR36_03025 [Betaproteobacteria bacterium]|nr:hypothetical protein [Betaproteobacteria bacterium]